MVGGARVGPGLGWDRGQAPSLPYIQVSLPLWSFQACLRLEWQQGIRTGISSASCQRPLGPGLVSCTLETSTTLQGGPRASGPGCPAVCPCSFGLSPLLVPRRDTSQRSMKESHPGTFFIVCLLLDHSVQTPLGILSWNPSSVAGPGWLLPISSFTLNSKIGPVTMAQDGSSVKGGGVTT